MPDFDLQSHSTHSDGALAPAQVVALAARAGVRLLALSDHDTVAGIDEALEAAGREGIEVLPAAEISAVDPGHVDVHILGYGLDHHDPALLASLETWRADRDARATRMEAALREVGLELDMRILDARHEAHKVIGRPHLAAAAFAHPANAGRIADEGLEDASALLEAYLIEDRPAYVGRTTPTVPEAIAVIRAAGGVAVWAHPFWDVQDPLAVIETLERFAPDGVEAFYVTHSREQTLLLADQAERLDLLTTGSSDFHGPEHRLFSRFAAHELHGREPRLPSR